MTSHPSPFYRQRQSNKTLDPTGQTAKFLYTILKQLDLKNIDWNQVASSLDITNGHAARMRWSRFRAQIEGLDNSYSRKAGRKKDGEKKRKKEKQEKQDEEYYHEYPESGEVAQTKRFKMEVEEGMKFHDDHLSALENQAGALGNIKEEAGESTSVIGGVTVHHPTMSTVGVPQYSIKQPQKQSVPLGGFVAQNNFGPAMQTPDLGWKQPSNSMTARMTTHWPQQYLSSPYGNQPYRPRLTGSVQYNPSMYSNVYQMPNSYDKSVQQHFPHSYQPLPSRGQSSKPWSLSDGNLTMKTNNHSIPHLSGPAAQQLQPQIKTPTSVPQIELTPSTQIQSNSLNQTYLTNIQATCTQEQAREMASQASYPWPYSEAFLLRNFDQATNSVEPELGMTRDRNDSGGLAQPEDASGNTSLIPSCLSQSHACQAAAPSNQAGIDEDTNGRAVDENAQEKAEPLRGEENRLSQDVQSSAEAVLIKTELELLDL